MECCECLLEGEESQTGRSNVSLKLSSNERVPRRNERRLLSCEVDGEGSYRAISFSRRMLIESFLHHAGSRVSMSGKHRDETCLELWG